MIFILFFWFKFVINIIKNEANEINKRFEPTIGSPSQSNPSIFVSR